MENDVHENARQEFLAGFAVYIHPFKSSDMILAERTREERLAYYERAQFLASHDVFRQELTEWKRKFYNELALQSLTDVERTALRKTLIAIQDFEKRIASLASFVHEKKSLQDIASKL